MIKIRIWNKELQAWDHPGFLQVWDDTYGITFKCLPEENYVIQQYTGLKDKVKKEIYTGDILYEEGCEENLMVEWKDGCFWAVLRTRNAILYPINKYNIKLFKWKVIGNIFENPELLK